MKFYCVSDNIDTQMGMRLAGIEGVVVHEAEETQAALRAAFADETIGIVLVTQKLSHLCYDLIYDYKLHQKYPLIVEIPDRHGDSSIGENITRYLNEAIGVKL